jgi:hypothetical protein
VLLYLWPVASASTSWTGGRILPRQALGLEQVLVQFRHAASPADEPAEYLLRMSRPPGAGLTVRVTEPPTQPMRELDAYTQKVIRARRRGAVYPFELVPMLSRNPDPGGADGSFTEYDLDADGVAARRPRAGAQHGEHRPRPVTTATGRCPEGMPGRAVGRPDRASAPGRPGARVCAAIALAQAGGADRWFAVSAGANRHGLGHREHGLDLPGAAGDHRVHQDGGESTSRHGHQRRRPAVLERRGHHAHAYQGILVMTPDSTMVLTGKQSLDYRRRLGRDSFGIGGYDRIMGPNGRAQYWAPDINAAIDILSPTTRTHAARGQTVPARCRSAPSTATSRLRRTAARAPISRPWARSSPRTPAGRSRSTSAR